MNKQIFLEHHIHFLSKHRGNKESMNQTEFIHSEKASFNIAFPLSSAGIEAISPLFNIYLPDWIPTEKLSRKKTGSITYMILPEWNIKWKINDEVRVKKAVTMADIEDFSLVQGRGFCENEEVFNEYYPWMREKNISNFHDKNQGFYIAYENEKPVGVCLSVNHKNVIGIYAVATLPAHRKQGISTSLMKKIVEEGIKNNKTSCTLQVMTNSYAHSFYRQLGFNDVFKCNIFAATQ